MLNTVNRQRRDLQCQVGDLVLLSAANLKLHLGTKHVKQFAPKFIGPFEVLERVADGRAYRIDLPSYMRLHPTLPSLRPYAVDTVSGRAQAAPKPDYLLCATRTRVPYIAITTIVHRNIVNSNALSFYPHSSLSKHSDQTNLTA
jgi:hypothetical protein